MQKVLIVVDYQYDFVSGTLPVVEADKIAVNIQREIDDPKYDAIIYTLDTHIREDYLKSEEGNMFPLHCEFNTQGWDLYKIKPKNREVGMIINEGVMEEPKNFSVGNEFVFMKDKFSIWEGNNSYSEWFRNKFDKDTEITIVGVATDFCVRLNAIGYSQYGFYNVRVISDAVKGIDFDGSLDKAIYEMKANDIKFI
jgi:nicotinamidase-related amidase